MPLSGFQPYLWLFFPSHYAPKYWTVSCLKESIIYYVLLSQFFTLMKVIVVYNDYIMMTTLSIYAALLYEMLVLWTREREREEKRLYRTWRQYWKLLFSGVVDVGFWGNDVVFEKSTRLNSSFIKSSQNRRLIQNSIKSMGSNQWRLAKTVTPESISINWRLRVSWSFVQKNTHIILVKSFIHLWLSKIKF
jgi:hypothetical protein